MFVSMSRVLDLLRHFSFNVGSNMNVLEAVYAGWSKNFHVLEYIQIFCVLWKLMFV